MARGSARARVPGRVGGGARVTMSSATSATRDGYAAFLDRRAQIGDGHGFSPVWLPDFLFDFQRTLVEWAILRGSSAIFADCGLGKTPIQLVIAENIVRHTNGRVLVLAPLAVSAQTVREGVKFGVVVTRCKDGKPLPGPGITITNYERLHLFDPADFVGAVCDESGILKSFDGAYRNQITAFMRKLRYRLLCTATPSPNDYTELGTSSEALGGLGHVDMLNRFFTNKNSTGALGGRKERDGWRFKGHAEGPFWRWVCSWARAVRKPSDLGFVDGAFILPPLEQREHVVANLAPAPGALFAMPAMDLQEQRAERRRTIRERCEKVAEITSHDRQVIAWCHLNDEGDLLEELIPGAVQVSGADSDDEKEERLLAFASGQIRALVTKPSIGAWGLNFQRCAHATFFPSHSFEQFYQAVRRIYRFGQERRVLIDIVTSEGERGVLENLQRKADAADCMFARLIEHMARSLRLERGSYGNRREEIPSWL